MSGTDVACCPRWNLWWGRPLKYVEYKKLNEFQRVCHFPDRWYFRVFCPLSLSLSLSRILPLALSLSPHPLFSSLPLPLPLSLSSQLLAGDLAGYLADLGYPPTHSYAVSRTELGYAAMTSLRNVRQNGPASFPYLPKTYILPDDRDKLIAEYKEGGRKQAYICKPKVASPARCYDMPAAYAMPGTDVAYGTTRVPGNVRYWRSAGCYLPTRCPYLADPLLINSRKFDLRLYVLVTSFDPLRVYLFRGTHPPICLHARYAMPGTDQV
eukprot:124676-Rhodomonas_salina.1